MWSSRSFVQGWIVTLAVSALLMLASGARAQVEHLAENKCLAGKVKVVGGAAAARARCLAGAAAKGTEPDACLQRASGRFSGGARPAKAPFAKLESRGGCITLDDSPALESNLAGLVLDLEAAVGGGGRSRCDAAKLKCLGKYLSGTLGCAAKGAKKGGAVDPKCLEQRAASLSDPVRGCWVKALAKGDCSLFSEAEAGRAVGDAFAQETLCALDPEAGPGCAGNPLDQFLAPGALSLVGVSLEGFNPLSAQLRFVLAGTDFSEFPEDALLEVNGYSVSPASLALSAQEIVATDVLENGRNDVVLAATDALGRPLHFQATVWAGSYTLNVALVDELGAAFTLGSDVRASLGDDQSVHADASTSSGAVAFENLPDRTILVQASTADNHLGIGGFVGSQGGVEVVMRGFDPPSPIANNDFSQGMDGWDAGGAAHVQVAPHVEGFPEPIPPPPPLSALAAVAPRGVPNGDLTVYTSGEGEQSVSRSFETMPGTTSVRVRYRFQTSEVPGGYFGTQFNDYFSVTIRSEIGGGSVAESNSMNGLGLGAFDSGSGATEWREATLDVDPGGDTIQVDLAVRNVADDRWDSGVAVDFVDENDDQVRPRLAWNRTDGGVDLFYRVESAELSEEATIEVAWADGTGYENRLESLLSLQVPQGTPAGEYGPTRIVGGLLAVEPDEATHLIAFSSETSVGALADVRITYGANANQALVWEQMKEVISDGLRMAGQETGIITSTARTPAEQARAMFNNLVKLPNTIAMNIEIQKGVYAAPGDQVIDTFAGATAGLNREQIVADRASVQATMLARIEALGPSNVSRHCGDLTQRNVLDMAASVFTASNGAIFVGAVEGWLSRLIDERTTNNCYHLELE